MFYLTSLLKQRLKVFSPHFKHFSVIKFPSSLIVNLIVSFLMYYTHMLRQHTDDKVNASEWLFLRFKFCVQGKTNQRLKDTVISRTTSSIWNFSSPISEQWWLRRHGRWGSVSEKWIYMLPLHFVTVSIYSVYANRSKNLLKLSDVMPAINSKKKHEFAVVT